MNITKLEPVLGNASVAYSRTADLEMDAREAFKRLNSRDRTSMNLDQKAQTLSQDLCEVWRIILFEREIPALL